MQYLLLVFFWILWCAVHSALISLTVTGGLQKKFPDSFRYYRIFYNLFSLITLAPVLLYSFSLRGEPLVTWQGPWLIVPVFLGAVALFFFLAGARHYDFLQFIGIRQIREEQACSVLTDDCSLDTEGVLSVVRHPWYSAGLLAVWARPLDPAAILTNLVICGYFVIGAMLEERKLIARFGRQYEAYQKRVSMFFPFQWACRRFSGK